MALVFPYILLANGIYSGLITGISSLTLGTCSMIGSIYSHKNPDADKCIRKLDLERKLKLIESVLNKSNVNSSRNIFRDKIGTESIIFDVVEGENTIMEDPIKLCLHYLHQAVEEIHNSIKKIHDKVSYHKTKWFSTWRTLNIKKQIEELEHSTKILDDRFNDLIKISQFYGKQ